MTIGTPTPVKIVRNADEGVEISWSDGETRRYTNRELRDACSCATCREQRKAPPQPAHVLTVLSEADLRPLRIRGMKPVGNYAYSIDFSDEHNTGIFTFELLRSVGSVCESSHS